MLGRVHGLVGTGLLLAVKLGLSLVSRGAIYLVEVRAEALLLRAALGVYAVQASVSLMRGDLMVLRAVPAGSARFRDLCKFQRLC